MKVSKASIVIIVCISGIIAAFYYLFMPKTIQSKTNPKSLHNANLIRHQGIDVNFRIQVDGQDVYYSPDFAPVEFDFREQIAWDKTGNVLVLEVAGKRLFAFNAEQKRQLSDSELHSVEYTPFFEYHFEGKLPEETKR
jgi:hypothetical protein